MCHREQNSFYSCVKLLYHTTLITWHIFHSPLGTLLSNFKDSYCFWTCYIFFQNFKLYKLCQWSKGCWCPRSIYTFITQNKIPSLVLGKIALIYSKLGLWNQLYQNNNGDSWQLSLNIGSNVTLTPPKSFSL